jgi:hypothetical protein
MSDEVRYPINTWDQIGSGGVFISRAYSPGRARDFKGWHVVGVGFRTDPDAAWYDNGCKTFLADLGEKDRGKAALERAKRWAGERYGIGGWKRNGAGDYIPADDAYPPLRSEVERKQRKA